MLDKRNLKSSDGKVVEIENKSIALCVAAEWEAQESVLKSHSLPLVFYSLNRYLNTTTTTTTTNRHPL